MLHEWQEFACDNLYATAAKRQKNTVVYGWPPVACYFCMRLHGGTLVQIVCGWLPDVHNFSFVWQPAACKLNQEANFFSTSNKVFRIEV
jgi:hypothetical protein